MRFRVRFVLAAGLLGFLGAGESARGEDQTEAPLVVAARQGDLAALAATLAAGADPDALYDGVSPLAVAVAAGQAPSLRALLDAGADVDLGGAEGTPLGVAAAARRLDLASLLVEAGADPDAKGPQGETALHRAASVDAIEVVRFLLAQGADVEARDRRGVPPLLYAIAARSLGTVDALLAAGADPMAKDAKDRGPSAWLRAFPSAEITQRLARAETAGATIRVRPSDDLRRVLQAAADGSTILLGAGTYAGIVWAEGKRLRLRPAGDGPVVLAGDDNPVVVNVTKGADLDLRDVILRPGKGARRGAQAVGSTLRLRGVRTEGVSDAIFAQDATLLVRDCRLTASDGRAVVSAVDTTLSLREGELTGPAAAGVVLERARRVAIRGTRILGCARGIQVDGTTQPFEARGVRVSAARAEVGVSVRADAPVLLDGLVVSGARFGLQAEMRAGTLTVRRALVLAPEVGILVLPGRGGAVRLWGPVVLGSTGTGIDLRENVAATLDRALVATHAGPALGTGQGGDVHVRRSALLAVGPAVRLGATIRPLRLDRTVFAGEVREERIGMLRRDDAGRRIGRALEEPGMLPALEAARAAAAQAARAPEAPDVLGPALRGIEHALEEVDRAAARIARVRVVVVDALGASGELTCAAYPATAEGAAPWTTDPKVRPAEQTWTSSEDLVVPAGTWWLVPERRAFAPTRISVAGGEDRRVAWTSASGLWLSAVSARGAVWERPFLTLRSRARMAATLAAHGDCRPRPPSSATARVEAAPDAVARALSAARGALARLDLVSNPAPGRPAPEDPRRALELVAGIEACARILSAWGVAEDASRCASLADALRAQRRTSAADQWLRVTAHVEARLGLLERGELARRAMDAGHVSSLACAILLRQHGSSVGIERLRAALRGEDLDAAQAAATVLLDASPAEVFDGVRRVLRGRASVVNSDVGPLVAYALAHGDRSAWTEAAAVRLPPFALADVAVVCEEPAVALKPLAIDSPGRAGAWLGHLLFHPIAEREFAWCELHPGTAPLAAMADAVRWRTSDHLALGVHRGFWSRGNPWLTQSGQGAAVAQALASFPGPELLDHLEALPAADASRLLGERVGAEVLDLVRLAWQVTSARVPVLRDALVDGTHRRPFAFHRPGGDAATLVGAVEVAPRFEGDRILVRVAVRERAYGAKGDADPHVKEAGRGLLAQVRVLGPSGETVLSRGPALADGSVVYGGPRPPTGILGLRLALDLRFHDEVRPVVVDLFAAELARRSRRLDSHLAELPAPERRSAQDWASAGSALLALGRTVDGVEAWHRATRGVSDVPTRRRGADALALAGRPEEGLALLRPLLEGPEVAAALRLDAAALLFQAGRYAEAADAGVRAAEAAPDFAEARWLAACALALAGREREALAHLGGAPPEGEGARGWVLLRAWCDVRTEGTLSDAARAAAVPAGLDVLVGARGLDAALVGTLGDDDRARLRLGDGLRLWAAGRAADARARCAEVVAGPSAARLDRALALRTLELLAEAR